MTKEKKYSLNVGSDMTKYNLQNDETVYINDSKGIGALLAIKRKELGLSTRAFANKYGFSSTVLNQLEHNKISNPSMKNLKAISNALEIPLNVIFRYYDVHEVLMKDAPISHKQNLIEALSSYGLPASCINDVIDYIKYRIVCSNKEKYNEFQDMAAHIIANTRYNPHK